jgi:cytochrome c peroxidase
MIRKTYIILLILVAGMIACNKDMVVAFAGFQEPNGFPEPAYHFATNQITKAGFELGRKLFYDPILSANNKISCSSCHIQTAAFSHRDHSVSHGIFDRLGTRNAPAIMNMAWSTSFMWDGGVFDLDLQPIAPITNHVEMADTLGRVLEKLRNTTNYPLLFQKAFGSDSITSALFLKALSQFMLMCISDQSKYDSVSRGQTVFTADEQAGYQIFQKNCSNCHKEPLFTDYSFRNNGLSNSSVDDQGRYAVTLNEQDKYKFKVPSLRNLYYTGPYMHDGRFLTLDAVLEHYNSQVKQTPNLDPLLQRDGRLGIALNDDEKSKILIFLKTLDDRSFLLNPDLSEP